MPYKILLVDDEKGLVKGLSHTLQREGFEVIAAYNGREALQLFERHALDLVILDLMLPEIDGLNVCRRLRKKSKIPIIMLTAKGDDVDRIVRLELGADDYLPKPFNNRELIARIRALLRRAKSRIVTGEEEIDCGNMRINLASQTATVLGNKVEFTRKEFMLLILLAKNPERVFERAELLEKVWGAEFYDLRTVDVCIGRLRKKIEENPASPKYILTRWGVGYYFTERNKDVQELTL